MRLLAAAILGAACALGGATAHAQTLDTAAPTLTAPAGADTYAQKLAIVYSLPTAPAPGTVMLTFTDAQDNPHGFLLTDDQSGSFTFDTAAPHDVSEVVAGPGPLSPGTYTVSLSYQDAALDPAATATATGVTVGSGTDAVVTTAAGPLATPYEIGYTLDDHCSSATLDVAGFTNDFNPVEAVAQLSGPAATAGSHVFSSLVSSQGKVDGSTDGVDSWSGIVPDGPSYAVTVSCVNEAGDAESSPAVVIGLRTSTVPPVIVKPANYDVVGGESSFTVQWVQAVAGDGSYQYVFTGPRNFTTTMTQRTTPASYPALVTDTITVALPSPKLRMPNGTYTLAVRYFDPLVQQWSTSVSVPFLIQSPSPSSPIETPPVHCVKRRCR